MNTFNKTVIMSIVCVASMCGSQEPQPQAPKKVAVSGFLYYQEGSSDGNYGKRLVWKVLVLADAQDIVIYHDQVFLYQKDRNSNRGPSLAYIKEYCSNKVDTSKLRSITDRTTRPSALKHCFGIEKKITK